MLLWLVFAYVFEVNWIELHRNYLNWQKARGGKSLFNGFWVLSFQLTIKNLFRTAETQHLPNPEVLIAAKKNYDTVEWNGFCLVAQYHFEQRVIVR